MRLPEPKFRGSAYGVFDETVKQLKKLRGSDSVHVRVIVGGGRIVIEPPRRIILVKKEAEDESRQGSEARSEAEPLEVKIFFRDLRRVLEVFRAANLTPSTLLLSNHILSIEAKYGGARMRGVIAGQVD